MLRWLPVRALISRVLLMTGHAAPGSWHAVAELPLATRLTVSPVRAGKDWRSPDASPRLAPAEQPRPARPTASEPVAADPPEVPALLFDRLIAAESLADARAAGREIALGTAVPDGQIWPAIAVHSTRALARREYDTVAKLGLGTLFWDAFYRPELATCGLPPVSREALLAIALNCFEACTHLPERAVIGTDAQAVYDAQDTRQRCQHVLAGLPLTDYVITTSRPRLGTGDQDSAAPDPAQCSMVEGDAALTRKRIFISYVREDSGPVDRIAAALRGSGFDVWLDRTHLVAGMRWKSIISKAIRSGDYFIACFSARYTSRYETYMNEELIIAVERLRSINRSRQWFIPVKLDECTIPDYGIGPGETLENLHYLDFSQDWDAALAELIRALSPRE